MATRATYSQEQMDAAKKLALSDGFSQGFRNGQSTMKAEALRAVQTLRSGLNGLKREQAGAGVAEAQIEELVIQQPPEFMDEIPF